MSYVKVKILPTPYNIEFKRVGKLIFDMNYIEFKRLGELIFGINYQEHSQYSKHWYNSKGQYHREDGPAAIRSSGTYIWFRCGKLHREDGPAIIFHNGSQFWYLGGVHYSEENFNEEIRRKFHEKSNSIAGSVEH